MWFKARKNAQTARPADTGLLTVTTRQRLYFRSVFETPARLNLAGHMREVRLMDISLQGALVEAPPGTQAAVGTRGRLRLSLLPTLFIAMDIAVARVDGHCVGLRYVHIDLDSMTHLRQLIERNSRDPHMLGRDLARLIGHA